MTATKKINATAISAKQMDEAVSVGKQSVEKAVEVTKAQVEKASAQTIKHYEEAANVSKENVDHLVSSFNVVSKGVEEIGRVYFDLAQNSVEAQIEATKAMFGARNVNELMDVQNEYMRNSYDKLTAEGAKISEMTLKLVNEVTTPIQSQTMQMIDRASKQFAA